MDLEAIVDLHFTKPLLGAIEGDKLIATEELYNSVQTISDSAPGLIGDTAHNIQTVRVVALEYILELRDGEQYKSPPSLADITEWVNAKGLEGILDPYAVLATIRTEGTTWDRKGGSAKLQAIINPDNVQRVVDIAVKDTFNEIANIEWQSR